MRDHGRIVHEPVESVPRLEHEESELVRRAQLGSSAAFDQLVVLRGTDLYRYLLVRLRNDADARDALQETIMAAWQGLPQLKRHDKFWPWLVAIAARQAVATRRRQRWLFTEREPESPGDDGSAMEFWDAVGQLPVRYRDVLVLRYRLEFTEEETAQALGIRVGTVKSRCARGRKALMELLG
jgi:RNA polymerase sigma-70 factor, ECF subfamily